MTTVTPTTLTGTYVLDPTHSRLGFVARHAMVTKVRGSFDDFEGTAVLDFDDPTKSTASVTFQIASIDTRNAQRDEHLRTNDFFDAPTYPTGSFVSTGVTKVDDETFQLHGDLTLKGTTKPVTVTFEATGTATDAYGNLRAGFEGRATISRKEWGITWNAALDAGGVAVGDKIVLELDVSAIKQA
jgi:polyisoprenoid-binding protein YceI